MSSPIALARELAAQPALWRPHVHHDPEQLTTTLLRDDDVTAWVSCWMEGQATRWHDHDGQGGALVVVRGQVIEEQLRPNARRPWFRLAGPGESVAFGPRIVHRVRHGGGPPAVTIHVTAYRRRQDDEEQGAREGVRLGTTVLPSAA